MSSLIVYAIILIPALIFVYIMFRANQRQMQRLADPKAIESSNLWMKSLVTVDAIVESKQETIKPEAKGLAKVDLELKIQPPEGEAVLVKTIWLVEVESLPELEVGHSIKIKYNPKKPDRIYPDVPWAHVWLFDA